MIIEVLNRYIFSLVSPIALMGAGLFFTLYLGAFHILHPIRTLRHMMKKTNAGGTSPFRALCLALAGTLGVGNIVGVASAISIGGAGAIFWMWVSAILAMTLKYAEILLAVKYRKCGRDGFFGGAVYYIRAAFESRKMKRIGGIIAAIFGALCVVNSLSMGCVMQINALSESVCSVADISPLLIGIVVCALCLLSVCGNRQRVGRISEIAVPLASIAYIIVCLFAIYVGRDKIFHAFGKFFSDAWSFKSGCGGIIGFLSSRALRFGTMRGLISNEAGCGTAPTAHASANTDSPYRQGIFGIVEVFFDTVVLCTLTALVIIIAGNVGDVASPMELCASSFALMLGNRARYFMAVEIFIFAFATMICWAHYGFEALRYFSDKAWARAAYMLIFCASAILGAVASADIVWEIADLAIGAMTLINLFVLFAMRREISDETKMGIILHKK